jgi:hypothetical protein
VFRGLHRARLLLLDVLGRPFSERRPPSTSRSVCFFEPLSRKGTRGLAHVGSLCTSESRERIFFPTDVVRCSFTLPSRREAAAAPLPLPARLTQGILRTAVVMALRPVAHSRGRQLPLAAGHRLRHFRPRHSAIRAPKGSAVAAPAPVTARPSTWERSGAGTPSGTTGSWGSAAATSSCRKRGTRAGTSGCWSRTPRPGCAGTTGNRWRTRRTRCRCAPTARTTTAAVKLTLLLSRRNNRRGRCRSLRRTPPRDPRFLRGGGGCCWSLRTTRRRTTP